MTKRYGYGPDWDFWIGTFVIMAVFFGLFMVVVLAPVPAKAPKKEITVHCEGEYRVFMRGEQIEVLYDPDCMKLAKT